MNEIITQWINCLNNWNIEQFIENCYLIIVVWLYFNTKESRIEKCGLARRLVRRSICEGGSFNEGGVEYDGSTYASGAYRQGSIPRTPTKVRHFNMSEGIDNQIKEESFAEKFPKELKSLRKNYLNEIPCVFP